MIIVSKEVDSSMILVGVDSILIGVWKGVYSLPDVVSKGVGSMVVVFKAHIK